MSMRLEWVIACGLLAATAAGAAEPEPNRQVPTPPAYREKERAALAEPFRGITAGGALEPGLFPLRASGVSTAPVVAAARAFLASLTPGQRRRAAFAMDSDEWRRWSNIHRYARQGVGFGELSPLQRRRALQLLAAALSAKGLEKARSIMKLNSVLAELTKRHDEYGEDLYFLTVMGEPSATAPWGWQLDGHHLAFNYAVVGDQVVATPRFWGSEPVQGRGMRVFGPEEAKGLAFVRALRPDQAARAIVARELPKGLFTDAFRDNVTVKYEGLRADALDPAQRTQLVDLIREYADDLAPDRARLEMDQVRAHLDRTWFCWMGGTAPDAVFYYRIHSPVVLIEFDHQGGTALKTAGPTRNHVHTVVRTPNGGDYGKDLLRQHYETARPGHGH
jgi:hypothetical protein